MKLFKTVLPIAVVGIVAFTIESCSQKKDSGSESNFDGTPATSDIIEFETRVDSVGFKVPDFFMGETVYAAIKYSIVWPEKIGQKDFEALRDSLLSVTFGSHGSVSVDQASKNFIQSSMESFFANSEDKMPPYEQVSYTEANDHAERQNVVMVNSDVTLLNPNILVVQVNNYSYNFGAAHGMSTARFMNYSIAEHQLLDANNMFKPGNDKAILDLINASAKEHYPGEGVLFDQPITSFDNFQVTEEDIVFVYQPYDVAPYSTGIVSVPVSQFDLHRFLTPLALNTLGLND